MTPTPLFLVSCVAEKAAEPCEARDLYRSDWFRKARAYVEALGADWLILSAEHGVLDPRQVAAPYDATLNAMPVADRRAWSAEVMRQLRQRGQVGRRVVILAGERYREFLIPLLEPVAGGPGNVAVPMRGLGIGEQKAWLIRAAAEALAAVADVAGDRQLVQLEQHRRETVEWFDQVGRAELSRADCVRYLGASASPRDRDDLRIGFQLDRRRALARIALELAELAEAIQARRAAVRVIRAERQARVDRLRRVAGLAGRRALELVALVATLSLSLVAAFAPIPTGRA
jgi:hypothetical protein